MVTATQFLSAVTPERLHLILMPTEACNFRCSYCYEDFLCGRMKKWVVSAVKDLLANRAGELRHLTLSWFGGEPLLARSIVEDVMGQALRLANENPRMRVESDMTTNAYGLTSSIFRNLLGLGIRKYQVTFDGPKTVHDQHRVRIRGGATFDRIWSNLLSIRQEAGDFQILVRLHVDESNASMLEEFLDDYGRNFGEDPRFKVFFRLLGRFGGPNDGSLPVFDRKAGQRAIEALRSLAIKRGIPCYVPEGNVCYAAQGNAFVLRADGRIGKCTLRLEHPRNQVGRIHAGGKLQLEPDAMKGWMRGFISGDLEALKCPMLGHADVSSPEPDSSARRQKPRAVVA